MTVAGGSDGRAFEQLATVCQPDMDEKIPRRSKFEQSLGWLLLALLLAACLALIWPFVSSILWAIVLTFATWPIYRRVLAAVGGRATLAAAIMACSMVAVIVLPFVIAGLSLVDDVRSMTGTVRAWLDAGPPAPEWLGKTPIIGDDATAYWESLAQDNTKLVEAVKPLVEPVSGFMLRASIALGAGIMELGLSILIAFFLFRDGVGLAARLEAGLARVAGDRGKHLLAVAGNTVRGVVYGILGTALVQGVIAGIGFAIAGVPAAGLLGLLTFCLSVVPVGPPLVWLPAALWLFHQGSMGWGIFMLVWGMGVSSVDNVVKPWIISQGSPMPFLLIFFGVVGGALVFGFIGLFVGPTLLAVGYRLVNEWASIRGAPAA
jgi:predicted PurR-regulated permease PerM